MNRELQRLARRNADQQTARIADMPTLRGFYATVTAVSPVKVRWHGSELTVTKVLPSYTPGVGDRVLCLLVDGQLTVVG